MHFTRRSFVRTGSALGLGAFFNWRGAIAQLQSSDNGSNPPSALRFTRYYVGRHGTKIITDKRFKTLLPELLPNPELPYWSKNSLYKSLPTFFSLSRTVVVDHHRWVTVRTAVAHDGTTRGLLWMDTASPDLTGQTPVVIWSNLLTNGQRSQLYLYSDKQLSVMGPEQVPNNFKLHLGHWLAQGVGHHQGPIESITSLFAGGDTFEQCYPGPLGIHSYFYEPS